jgi:thiosulfate dehydrogenase
MSKELQNILRILIGIATFVALIFITIVLLKQGIRGVQSPTHDYIQAKLDREAEVIKRRHLSLVDPGEAPNSLRAYAEKGFKIMVETQIHAKDYVGGKLECINCHFAAGDTTGGAQGSISLVGVAAKYPAFDKRDGKVIDLSARVNNCFKKSMNGKPLPLDSELMLSLICYLHWISSDVAIYTPIPWLGLQPLKTKFEGNPESGKRVYHIYCALCHRDDGEGTKHNPPLWGPNSFNDGAGLNRPELLAPFIYWNMPIHDSTPVLTEEQAWDVAAYIISQPRPHYEKE